MNYSENNLTLLTPIYNTDIKCLEKHAKSIEQFPDMKKIYLDDGITCENTKYILYNKIAKLPNTNIITMKLNYGQINSISKMLNSTIAKIETDYIIRVDADDELLHLPSHKTNNSFDILFLNKVQKNMVQSIKNGGSMNGSIFKKEIYKNAYSEMYKISKMNKWIHEDIWYGLNIYYEIEYENKDYNVVWNQTGKRAIKRGMHKLQETYSKVLSRHHKRSDTFLLWTVFYDRFNLYYDIMKKVYGYDSHMKSRFKKLM